MLLLNYLNKSNIYCTMKCSGICPSIIIIINISSSALNIKKKVFNIVIVSDN